MSMLHAAGPRPDSLRLFFPPELPVSARRDELAQVIRDNQVVIVAGQTGSGKTTQLPKICLQIGRRSIGHTQPRRIAARTIAERIAEELGVEVGGLVGYQVRFTDHAGPDTRIKLMTDGILLNQLHHDRLLRAYDTIIVDEAHERSLNVDFLLGYLKRILPARPDLKVIITSATIDPESFARHFGTQDAPAPVVEVSGRTFPVEVRYRPLLPEAGGPEGVGAAGRDPDADELTAGILAALAELDREKPGDVLVFLSGQAQIRDTADAIRSRLAKARDERTEVLPLYGRLSAAEQHRVFAPRAPGVRRRIVLATNVAETSLTVPGIRYVIDAGTARVSRYSARAKVQRLPIEPISQASAQQRSGRSGRTSPGIAIRLYSEEDYAARSPYTEPEIRRTNLASVILQMLSLRLGSIADFPFLTPPDPRGIKDGLGLLTELGAIDRDGRITPVGRDLARLPIEPRFGRMVLEAERLGVARPVRIIVAGLTIQDPRERPLERRAAADQAHARFTDRTSDFLTLLNLWDHLHEKQKELSSSAFRRMCKAEFLNYLRVREWQEVEHQLKRLLKTVRHEAAPPEAAPHEAAPVDRARPSGTAARGDTARRRPGAHGRGEARSAQLGRRPDTVAQAPGAPARTAPDPRAQSIHQALLAGLLSQIGLRDDRAASGARGREAERHKTARRRPGHDYLGSRQTRFTLHPSSALAKKPPQAVMTAELVETSRLFARMNAAIDPAWAEEPAGDLAKHTYAEPHWEKKRGTVVAYETVTVYGVPIVVRRRVAYRRVDPALCRELFLRHALVDGEFTPHAGRLYDFLRTNNRLRAELTQREERTRRRESGYADEAVAEFYAARIPAHIASVPDFEAWWRTAHETEPGLLTMSADLLTKAEDDGPDADDYPGFWHQADQTYTLRYRFDPGAEDDGVSVEVPLALLARLHGEGFDWQVPGLRRDLIQALLKSLPKTLRRHVVPAGDWADTLVAQLPAQPPAGVPLTAALASAIRRLAGVIVAPGDFAMQRVPPHLRMTFCALDLHGRVAGRDKDLPALQERLAQRARQSVARVTKPSAHHTPTPAGAAQPAGAERTGITSWDFDAIPRQVDTRLPAPQGGHNTVRAYPSLVLEGGKVALRYLSTPAERRRLFPAAVRRLLVAAVPSPAPYVLDHLTAAEKLSLASGGYPSTAALMADCLAALADEALRAGHPDGMIFTQAEFEATRDRLQSGLVDRMFQTAALLARIFTAARTARAKLREANSLAWLAALTDMRAQLDALVFPGFVSRTGLAVLPHLPRYLAALLHRVDSLPRDAGRDRVRMNEAEEALALYRDAGGSIPADPDADPRLTRVRWLLEEFRVSLFAQHLGTERPVSLKRIRKALAEASSAPAA